MGRQTVPSRAVNMKCVLVLMLVAAASGLTYMPLGWGNRATVYSSWTGMPMAFLRKKRDVTSDEGKSVAYHVRNVGFHPMVHGLRYAGMPYIFRKKRDTSEDQQADSALLTYSYPSVYSGWNNWGAWPYIYRKKRDTSEDQQADSALLAYSYPSVYSGWNNWGAWPYIYRKKRDTSEDQQADSALLTYSYPTMYSGWNNWGAWPYIYRKKRDTSEDQQADSALLYYSNPYAYSSLGYRYFWRK